MRYILLFIFTILLASCNSIEEPTIKSIKDIEVKEFSTSQIIAQAVMVLDNPNGFSLDLEEADVFAYADDVELAHITQPLESKMPANEAFDLPITFKMDLNKLYADDPMLAISKGLKIMSDKQLSVKFKGTIKAGKGSIKVKIPIDQVEVVKF